MKDKWIQIIAFILFLGTNDLILAQETTKISPLTPSREEAEKKAEDGDLESQIFLGAFCENHKDYSNAAKWYRKAAEKNNAFGQYRLGELYYKGLGVTQDDIEAYKWIKLSLVQREQKSSTSTSFQDAAEKRLKELGYRLTEKQRTKAEGLINIFLREM